MLQELVKIRIIKAAIMSEVKEIRQRCERCNRITMWSTVSVFNECMIRESSNNEILENSAIMNKEEFEMSVSEVIKER